MLSKIGQKEIYRWTLSTSNVIKEKESLLLYSAI